MVACRKLKQQDMHLISQQVHSKAVAVLGEVNLSLVMVEKAGNHSGTELYWTEVGGDGEFIFGRKQSFQETDKMKQNKICEENITEYCNGEMPRSKQEPMLQVCVSICTIKTNELWFKGSGPSEVMHWYQSCCWAPLVPKCTLLPSLHFFLPCFPPCSGPAALTLLLPLPTCLLLSEYCLKTPILA